jgi:FKBP-type peptidyl-prolyl cis-trans isomerase (trigger factor)
MQVSVEAPNKLERRMTVTVPVATVEEAYDKRIVHLAKTVKINGYRQGKIPPHVIRERYSETAHQEALSEVIQASLYAAINQEKLNPAGTPIIEPINITSGQPLEFIATFEIVPVVDSVNFNVDTLEKEKLVIAETDIDAALERLRKQFETTDKMSDEDFVKKLGIESGRLEDLISEIKKNLQREGERIVKAKLKNQLFNKLFEQNTMEVPKALIEREAKRIHDEIHPHHAGQDHGHSPAEMAVFNDSAKRNVTLGLLIGYLIKQHHILVDPARVQAHLTQLASIYQNPAEVITAYEKNKRAMAEIEMHVLEEQVVEKLLENVTLTEKIVNYQELTTQ